MTKTSCWHSTKKYFLMNILPISNCFSSGKWNYWTSREIAVFKSSALIRSSRPKMFYRKGVLKNFTKFTGKYLCQSLFFDKVAALRQVSDTTRLRHRCFLVIFAKCLRILFLYKTPGGYFYILYYHCARKPLTYQLPGSAQYLQWKRHLH